MIIVDSWIFETLIGDIFGTAPQLVIVNQRVCDRHDIEIHAVLPRKVDNSFGVAEGQMREQAKVQPSSLGFCASSLCAYLLSCRSNTM